MKDIPEFQIKSKGVKPLDKGIEVFVENKKYVSEVYEDVNLNSFCAVNCQFLKCTFRNLKIQSTSFGAGMAQSTYNDCVFENVDFFSPIPGVATFENCSFINVDARQFICNEIEFINCTFSGRFRKVVLNGSTLTSESNYTKSKKNRITNNDFRGVRFEDFSFRGGVNLEDQRLPMDNGFVYIKNGKEFLDEKRIESNKIKDQQHKSNVVKLIDIYMYDVNEGQNQLYVCMGTVPKKLRDAYSWLFTVYA